MEVYSTWSGDVLRGRSKRGHVGIDSEVILFPEGQVDRVGIYGISMAGELQRFVEKVGLVPQLFLKKIVPPFLQGLG